MNWIIFTTECSGKTTFCKTNANKLGIYDLIDYDKIETSVDEVVMIELMLKLKTQNNQIYFTNLIPPKFILNCNNYFDNISFGIIKLTNELLKQNIENRHHKLYNSTYIIEHNKLLGDIVEEIKPLRNKIIVFNSFDDFKHKLYPPTPKFNLKQRIIRL